MFSVLVVLSPKYRAFNEIGMCLKFKMGRCKMRTSALGEPEFSDKSL